MVGWAGSSGSAGNAGRVRKRSVLTCFLSLGAALHVNNKSIGYHGINWVEGKGQFPYRGWGWRVGYFNELRNKIATSNVIYCCRFGSGCVVLAFFFFLFLTGGSWTYGMDQLSRSWFGWGVFWEWGETREGKQTQEVALCRIRSQKLNITLHFFALSEESERRNKPEMALSRRHVCMTTLNTYIESTVQQGAELQACVMRLSHG